MRAALCEAEQAAAMGEVPIGAVAVVGDAIIARAHNVREATHNPLGHAEILLIEQVSRTRQAWRLDDVTVVVTCEPCLMCVGAMLQARIPRVIYGCADPKAGACGSLYTAHNDPRLNHRIDAVSGVSADECGALLSVFFRARRG